MEAAAAVTWQESHSRESSARQTLFLLLLVPFSTVNAQQQHDDLVPVQLAEVRSQRLAQQLPLSGSLTAERSARLSPRVDGLVDAVLVDAGDTVNIGHQLLRQDATLARLALQRSQAEVEQATAAMEEARRLLAEGERLAADKHIAATQVDTRRAELALAEAALGAARGAAAEQDGLVQRHVLPAPFDGVIVRRLTTPANGYSAARRCWSWSRCILCGLTCRRRRKASPTSPTSTSRSRLARSVPDRRFPAHMSARVPVGDANARSFPVRIEIDEEHPGLLPGVSARALISLPGEQRLTVPRDALQRYPDGSYSAFVAVEAEGGLRARERTLTLGRSSADEVEVLDGLEPGERVVVRGNEGLRDDTALRIAGED